MTDELPSLPLSRSVRVDQMPERGFAGTIEATDQERSAIARLLDLISLETLQMEYTLQPRGKTRARVTGRLEARGEQRCVVTLDPLPFVLDGPIDLELWPEAEIDALELRPDEANHEEERDWPEPIVAGVADLGALLYQLFATRLDPYPRKSGAVLDTDRSSGEGKQQPFAALSRLKRN